MSDAWGGARDALGLSIGTMNLVAARAGGPPVSRRAVVTLWDNNRPPEVGVPSQNPELTSPNLTAQPMVLRGFVERVGDPVPLVAADGSAHRGEALTAMALEALARTAGYGGGPGAAVLVVSPAHWGPAAVGALRSALRESPTLSPGGVPPLIVSDATAALAALQVNPGLPTKGVVALCDFGASGSSITLADAGANFAPIGETVRVGEFGGDQIDQLVLSHVLAGIRSAGRDDTTGTAAVGPLTRLREECRLAKERLSSATVTSIPADLPGFRSDVRLTRAELDDLIATPLTGFLDALGDALERNRIPAVNLAAVATAGAAAATPLITQRLSEALRVPVIAQPEPGLTAAAGATLLAARGAAPDSPTSVAVTAADAPTGLAPAAWAASTAGRAASESASDGSPSATFRALAWSQDDEAAGEPVPYAGGDYYTDPGQQAPAPYPDPGMSPQTGARPAVEFGPASYDADESDTVAVAPPLPWYRRPALIFGVAAALAAVAVGGLAVKLTDSPSTPTTTTTRVTKPGEPPSPAPPPPPTTITMTGSNGQTTVTTVTPTTTSAPPPTTSSEATSTTTTPTTTTTTTPTTTSTTTTTTTTTTRTTTTTTQPPTTTAPSTTTAPPTTTAAPPTTTAAPPTTTAAPVVTTTAAPVVTTQAVVTESAASTASAPLE